MKFAMHTAAPTPRITTALEPGQMITYTEAAQLLRVTTRTLRRRVAEGRYLAYGENSGRRLLYQSILADIEQQCSSEVR